MTGPTRMPRALSRSADVVVIGSGVAGIMTALSAAEKGREVELVTKTALGRGSSAFAQGGVAAAIGDGDSPSAHAMDTMNVGAGLCDPKVVRALTMAAPEAVRRLSELGARFDLRDGRPALGREGGHGAARIIHARGDATGAEVMRALCQQLLDASVTVREHCIATRLVLDPDGSVNGVEVGDLDEHGHLRGLCTIDAGAVVLATGGLGQAFATTTNPPESTGDGLALAARAGARVRDVELIQFHPTVLYQPGLQGQRPLLTEALRGAGAIIRKRNGEALMAGVHPLLDLAPRDVVALTIARYLEQSGEDYVFLDLRPVEDLCSRFPTAVANCRAVGLDLEKEPVPIRPAAHYACGGVEADLDGRTSLRRLFAVGEVAATGAHGANRLASNSLLEAVVAGGRAGRLLAKESFPPRQGEHVPASPGLRREESGAFAPFSKDHHLLIDPASRPRTCEMTEQAAGIVREGTRLAHLIEALGTVPGLRRSDDLDLSAIEASNLHLVSRLIATGALAREETRGCHQRLDHPEEVDRLRGPIVMRLASNGSIEVVMPTPLPEVLTERAS